MVFLVVVNVTNANKKEADLGLNGYEDISDLWINKNGQSVDFSAPELYEDEHGDIWLYCQLDEKTQKSNSLVFRSKNTFVEVFANEKLIYKTDIVTAPFSNYSPGTRWNIVELEPEQQGTLSMKINVAYDDGKCTEDYDFKISIAMGVAYCDKISKESIEQAEKLADQDMYKNKLELKTIIG